MKELSIQPLFMETHNRPILVCVGKEDLTISPKISYRFVQNAPNDKVDLLEIDHADHTFCAKIGNYAKVDVLLRHVINWIQNIEKTAKPKCWQHSFLG